MDKSEEKKLSKVKDVADLNAVKQKFPHIGED